MGLKRKKQHEGSSNMVRGEDRISGLPSPILHHILSFLPFKNIVRTCVLAKRWRFVWISVPNLVIGHWRSPTNTTRGPRTNISKETDRFMNFMDRLFESRDMSNIGKFSLSCDKHCDEDRVHSWLTAVARRDVEELSLLSEDERDSYMIPSLLFTCETLTLLKIHMPISLNIPTNVHLPKLKVLRLINIVFTDGPSIEKLCSNCLILGELEINNCIIEDITELSISSHTLKRIDARLCGEDNGWKLTTVPECLLSHLRVLEFRQFSGDQRELGAVKLFSENARVLQKLIISPSSALSRDLSSKSQVKEQLQMLPRASTNCKLTFKEETG
ncbi:putative F-box protein At1g58310 [Papaver somniferum]|uniref:putative F-box protein At1g58310 n=1 Tax=Papaver somniferum TaxID=3469 RepID=UPI000E6F9B26|nr:putative F-box protein At1g58310 [Papaver somniferum]